MIYNGEKKALESRWPRGLRWLEPHRAEQSEKKLYRCSCGRLMWSDVPQEISRLHLGHQLRMATDGSMWEFAKMKLGWLNRPTLKERLQQRGWV